MQPGQNPSSRSPQRARKCLPQAFSKTRNVPPLSCSAGLVVTWGVQLAPAWERKLMAPGLLHVNIFSGNSPWEGWPWCWQAGTLGATSVTSLVFMRSLYAGICGLIATLHKPVNIYLESLPSVCMKSALQSQVQETELFNEASVGWAWLAPLLL